MMNRCSTELLAQFCIVQRNAFDPCDWTRRHAADGAALALAAKYLSLTSWYGHAVELEQIAARIAPATRSSGWLHRESQSIDFDLPYFSAAVRLGVAMSHATPAPRREPWAEHGALPRLAAGVCRGLPALCAD